MHILAIDKYVRYWTREFRRHIDKKRSARMTAIPQLDVPDILVDDEEDRERIDAQRQRATVAGPPSGSELTPAVLAAADALRPPHQSWSAASADISSYNSASPHPLSLPRTSPSMRGHQSQNSAFSFEIQEPGTPSGQNSRHNSTADASQVRELLDDSVWVDSIRRSATVRKSMRRSDWGSYR